MFVKFHQRRKLPKAAITVHERGAIYFSKELAASAGIAKGDFLWLLYERETRRFALQAVQPGESPIGAAKVSQLTRGLIVSARKFCKSFGIAPGTFDARLEPSQNLLICTPANI